MTQPNKLMSLQEIERALAERPDEKLTWYARIFGEQLLDTMRENERLYESIRKIEELAASLQAECRIKAKTYKEMMNWSHDHIANEILALCGELDNRNKESGNG